MCDSLSDYFQYISMVKLFVIYFNSKIIWVNEIEMFLFRLKFDK